MAGVDSSLYSSFIGAQQSPIQQVSQGMGLLTALKGYQSKMAAGRALSNATDSQGNVDYNRAINNMAADPQGQFGLSDFVNEQVQNQKISAATGAEMLQNTVALQSIIGKAAASMASNENLQPGDIVDNVSNLWAEAYATGLADKYPHLMDGLISIIPQLQGLPNESSINRTNPLQPGYNPTARSKQQVLSQIAIQGQSAADAANMAFGNLIQQNTGANISTAAVSPVPGVQPRQVGNTPVQIPPTQTQEMITPAGAPAVAQTSQLFGQPPTGIQAPGSPSVPTGPVAPSPTPNAVQTGFGPEQVAPIKRFNDEFAENSAAVTNGQNQMIQMKEALSLLPKLKTGGGGQAALQLENMAVALQRVVGKDVLPDKIVDGIMGGGPGAYAAAQEFTKIMTGTALSTFRQQAGAQNKITNMEFATFLERNPNLDTDPQAVQKMFSLFQRLYQISGSKLQAMTQVQNDFQKGVVNPKTGSPDLYSWDNDWNQYLNSRGYTDLKPEQQSLINKFSQQYSPQGGQ